MAAKQNEVFISYSRRDKEFVRTLDEALQVRGLDAWIDWEDIPPNADWMQEIKEGIEAADSMIFVISPDSLNSKVCCEEVEHALQHNKRLIPILHREIERPGRGSSPANNPLDRAYSALGFDTTAERLYGYIGPQNWIYFRAADDFEKAVETLFQTIFTDLEYVKSHTRLTMRATEWDRAQRMAEFVLRGEDLLNAETWLENSKNKMPEPTQLQQQFIMASRYEHEKELQTGEAQRLREDALRREAELRERQTKTTRRFLAVSLSLFVVALGMAMFASLQFIEASDERDNASTQAFLAEQNASTAIIAQGQAISEARNASTQAALARQNEATAFAAQNAARSEARNASTQAALAQQNASTATVAQGKPSSRPKLPSRTKPPQTARPKKR
ncbi:MAG: toll/interleukin-1 receptor domain-containing protein [Anaerolineae bacterium]|nr:toll/interleukin-1 receptor domain-containing protein [Anaerolineae bacterium]